MVRSSIVNVLEPVRRALRLGPALFLFFAEFFVLATETVAEDPLDPVLELELLLFTTAFAARLSISKHEAQAQFAIVVRFPQMRWVPAAPQILQRASSHCLLNNFSTGLSYWKF